MADSIPGPSDLHTRLARLEQRQRWWRVSGFMFMAAGAGALVGYRPAPPEVLQAERIELVTRQGLRQVLLAADSLGLTVTLFDLHGLEAASFRFNHEPRLAVLNRSRREVAGLGALRPQHLVQ